MGEFFIVAAMVQAAVTSRIRTATTTSDNRGTTQHPSEPDASKWRRRRPTWDGTSKILFPFCYLIFVIVYWAKNET